MTKVLIIVAHPDDEVLGCGGYISKFSKKKSFKIVFMAEGTSCRFTKINLGTKKVIKEINKRKKMAIKALNFLGVKNYKFYNYPCGRLDGVEIIDLNKIIEAEIKSYKPNIILTHNENDCNNDHRIIYRSVMMASRPTKKNNFLNKIMSFEILSSTEWNYTKSFEPNYFETLSIKEVKNKCKALRYYKSELQKKPMPRSEYGIKTLANYRGIQTGNHYAEAYKLIKYFSK